MVLSTKTFYRDLQRTELTSSSSDYIEAPARNAEGDEEGEQVGEAISLQLRALCNALFPECQHGGTNHLHTEGTLGSI